MAYTIDEVLPSQGGGRQATVDFATANKQAKERAKKRQLEIEAARKSNASSDGTSTYTPVTEDDDDDDYGGSSGFDWAAYYAELQRQAQERANQAYERNMARIASAYDSASGSLKGNYDSTVDRLNATRDKSMGDVRTDAEDSLRQAYINNMLTRKNLNQRLSAMGYNGGATESTMSSLENQYGNSRTGINETLNKNIADLDATYGDNLAAALQSYNSAKANLDLQRMQLEMQAENARNNMIDSSMSANMTMDPSYLSALQAAITNQGQYTYDPTKATNDFIAGQAMQAQSADMGSDFQKYLQQLALEAQQGNPLNLVSLANGNPQTLASILKMIRYQSA